MAKLGLAPCLAVTLPHEGGYSDHPRDPGGATNMGITHLTLAASRGVKSVTKAEVKALTLQEATAIYETRYWRPIRGGDLPAGVDLAVFDFGVNSGPPRAVKYLQAVVGVPQDGRVGTDTLNAAVKANGKATIQALCGKRLGFMQGLPIFDTFKRGWTRRVADVEAKGVAMWLRASSASPATARQELQADGDKAKKTATVQQAGAGVGGIGGGGVSGNEVAVATDPNLWLIGSVGVVAALVVLVLVVKAFQNRERAAAYAAEAAK